MKQNIIIFNIKPFTFSLTLYSMIEPFDTFEILCIWKIKNLLQRSKCSIFHKNFQKYSKLYFIFLDFFQCYLNIENYLKIACGGKG